LQAHLGLLFSGLLCGRGQNRGLRGRSLPCGLRVQSGRIAL